MPVSAVLNKLRCANKSLRIKDISDKSFEEYGRILKGVKAEEVISYVKKIAKISDEVIYEPSVTGLEKDKNFVAKMRDGIFGGMPVQVGWCYGRNSMLDGLEYHKGIEVVVAVTDIVVILGDMRDIKWQKGKPVYSSAKSEIFYIKKNTVVEFHAWCLHFAPIHVDRKAGFATVVVLPKDTNTPLKFKPENKGESKMLFAKNKWLLVHKSAKGLIKDGACCGISGKNIKVLPVK